MKYFYRSLFIFAVILVLGTPAVSFAIGPTVTLTAGIKTLTATGQGTSLAWTVSSGATNCTSTGPWGSFMSQPFSGSIPNTGGLSLPSNVFSITCVGPGGSTTVSEEVKIFINGNSPNINSFTAVGGAVFGNFYSFQRPNQDWTFSWTATGAIYCALSSPSQGVNFTGQLPISGSRILSIFADETYTLSCPAAVGAVVPTATAQYSVVRNLNPVGPIVNFSSSATSVGVNQDFTLTWSSSGASACFGGGDGSFSLYGNSTSGTRVMRFFSPGTFIMTLRCDSANGGSTTRSVDVTVLSATTTPSPSSTYSVDVRINNLNGPIATTPSTQALNLTWSINPAGGGWSCRTSDSSGVTPSLTFGIGGNGSGVTYVRPTQAATYTVSCTNAVTNQTISDSVSVSMGSPATSTTPITVDLFANGSRGPVTIARGDTVRLIWARGPATLLPSIVCTGSGATSAFDTRVTQENTFNPTWNGLLNGNNVGVQGGGFMGSPDATTTYSVRCTDAFGGNAVSSSVTVNIVGVSTSPYAPIVPGSVNPLSPVAPVSPVASPAGGDENGSGGTCDAPITATLRFGNRGAQVLLLQKFLVDQELLDEENTSGYFGPLTRAAVQRFQVLKGIASVGSAGYGQVGPRTRAVINALCGNSASSEAPGIGLDSPGQNSVVNDNKKVSLTSSALGGNSYRLAWTSVGVTSCTSNDFFISTTGISTSGNATVTTATVKTYAISCVKSTGVEEDTVTVGGNTITSNPNDTNGSMSNSVLPDLSAGAPTTTTAKAVTSLRIFAPIINSNAATIPNSGRADSILFYYFFQVASATNGGGTIVNNAASPVGGSSYAAGLSLSANSFYTFPTAGTYSIRMCSDQTAPNAGGMITESNENNNCGPWGDVVVTN